MKLILASDFDIGFPQIETILAKQNLLYRHAVYIPTAAHGEGYEPEYERNEKLLEDMNIKVSTFDLKGRTPSQLREAFDGVGIIYVGGGNSFYLLEHMQKSGFKEILLEKLREGVIYIGSSAGSIVCSPDITYSQDMDDPAKGDLKTTQGLGLIDVAFLPHLNSKFLGDAAIKISKEYAGEIPLKALNDEQVMYVEDRSFTIL